MNNGQEGETRAVSNPYGWSFRDDAFSRVKQCGNITEVTAFEVKPKPPDIKRLDKDTYLDGLTGEVKAFVHRETRAGNIREVKRSFAKMRDVINTNVTNGHNCRMLTFTYRENMMDCQRLYKDFVKFWQKWKRYSVKRGIPPCEYIAVVEPQVRGAWHLHVIFIWEDEAPPFISYEDVSALWGHGWVDQRLGKNYIHADNLGAYLTAYFENVPLEDVSASDLATGKLEIIEKTYYVDGEEVTKKFAKGLRFALYPAGMQIFRCSRGCKKPIVTDSCFAEAKEKAGASTPTFSKFWDVENEHGKVINHIGKLWYNSKRDTSIPESD